MIKIHQPQKILYDRDGSIGRLLVELDDFLMVELTLESNAQMENHSMPVDVLFYIVKGEGILEIEGFKNSYKAGDVVKVDKSLSRSWKNENEEEFIVLVLRKE
ncbi:MAG: cupin domain-containing protein [Candidatus Delongbacteria bacterium]|nr:cupin domain-containing protein [Candidatus Delongbacteria bacterium]MBN2835623.1 cupin domain-containing protein [Candidatus Delongbacteria bacterium]